MIDKYGLLIMLASLALTSNAGLCSEQPEELTIFCASGIMAPFNEIGHLYENTTGINVVFNFDGVQALRAQVENGAYADLFVSSSYKHLNALKAEDLIDNGSISLIARDQVVLVIPKDNPGKIENLSDIARPGTKIIMGLKDVPIGDYARLVLDNLEKDPAYGPEYKEEVLSNVVSQETSANHVVAKVALGEADVGFGWITKSTEQNEKKIAKIEIPDKYNILADFNIGVLKQSEYPDQAQDFIDLVKSDKGRAILEEYDFQLA
jgi:molybdate transport system substrate-binding protein